MKRSEAITKAEALEAAAAILRNEGIVYGPEGAEDLEQAAQDWREFAEVGSWWVSASG